jgi:GNAT superfamily N-acetyltransferase
MQGATLFRFLPALQDDFSGGMHVDVEPSPEGLRQWLSSWEAFDAPGRLRWPASNGKIVDHLLREACEAAGFKVSCRGIWTGALAATDSAESRSAPPDGVSINEITRDVRQWASFEVLARWIDIDQDPARWAWRAKRVRHLVEGGRGRAFLARTSAMPIGIAVVLAPPDHRPDAAPALAVVVHKAHRGRGVGRALSALAAATVDGPVTVLGPALADASERWFPGAAGTVETLIEVHRDVVVRDPRT